MPSTQPKETEMTQQTAPHSELAARTILQGDWDANGTASVYLPRETAEKLILARGWHKVTAGPWRGLYCSPRGSNYDLDSALQLALVAEAL